MSLEKQREKILKKLDEHYSFPFIENYISIEEIIDGSRPFKENIELLKTYLAEELLVGSFSSEIMRAIGNDCFMKLKDDLTCDEFQKIMSEIETKE